MIRFHPSWEINRLKMYLPYDKVDNDPAEEESAQKSPLIVINHNYYQKVLSMIMIKGWGFFP